MQEVLKELFTDYYKDVYAYLYSLSHDAPLSEDLASEVFLEVVKSVAKFRGESDVKTWLFAIARHRWFAYLRTKRRQVQTEALSEFYEIPGQGQSVDESYQSRALAEHIRALLKEEAERTQGIVQMRLEGFSFYEIGVKYGISESSARVIDFRAKAKVRKRQLFSALLMIFGIFFGLGLTAGSDMFYNSLIMPVIGALGYAIFRWKALYNVPLLLFLTHILLNFFRGLLLSFRVPQQTMHLVFFPLLLWTVLYSVFALLGVLLAGLLHYAFRRAEGEKTRKNSLQRVAAFVLAAVLVLGLGVFANALVGNPISHILARRAAAIYLKEQYASSDFSIEEVNYSFKDGHYYAHIISQSSADSYFSLAFDMSGNFKWDNYEQRVTNRENTASRLWSAYRSLADSVLKSHTLPFTAPIAYGDLEFGRKESGVQGNVPSGVLGAFRFIPLILSWSIHCQREAAQGQKTGLK